MSDKILARVRLLLDRAEHPNTPEAEAELCFQRANILMTKHAIDEAMLRSTQTKAERQSPTRSDIKLGEGRLADFWPALRTILGGCADANRVRAVISYGATPNCALFGFAEDVAWVEMLYTSIYFSFISQVNPKWDLKKGYDENVYNFKVAGYKWEDVNRIAMEHGEDDGRNIVEEERYNFTEHRYEVVQVRGKKFGALFRAYKRHAKKIGDDNVVATTNFDEYRRQFADAFSTRIMQRFYTMQSESEKVTKEMGAELVLVDRMEDIDEMMFGAFPHLRPPTEEEIAERNRRWREQEERKVRERQEMLDAMTPQRRAAFLEAEERERRREENRNQRYWRDQDRKKQRSAHMRGREAANKVDLRRTGGKVSTEGQRKELK